VAYHEVPGYFLTVGVVIIVVLVLVIIFLFRKKNKLHQKLEMQKRELEKVREDLQRLLDGTTAEIMEREFELLNRLISALEYRDIETANHITRMANYSRLIAKHLFPVDSPMASLIFLAAALHDIGKIGISDKILSKPEKLSEKEFNQMKRHTLIGYDILKDSSSEVIQLAAVIALNHHERYDGSGYPRGLKGEEIPIAGRIVAIADYFDALMSKRVYKDAWSIEKVLEALKKRGGKIFDPVCLEAFFKSLDEILKIKDKYPDLRKSIDRDIEIEDELVNNEMILPEKQKSKIYPRISD
jgi:response regulator RpfG family c-di-GMP phosphodiesterase